MNPKMANFAPFNGHQVKVSNFHISTPSEMAVDSNISSPSTFKSWGSSSSSQDSPLKNNCGKLGLGMITSLYDHEADEATFGLWKSIKSTTKTTLFRHDIKLHTQNAAAAAAAADDRVVRPILFSVNYMLTLAGIPDTDGVSVSPNLRISDTVYGPRGNPSVQRIVRIVWPCILASPEIRLALIREALGCPPGSIQPAICTTHGNVGILKLEEIERTEEYTCIIHHQPEQKVVHMYNECVLIFPPNELNHFLEKNESLSPPVKLNSDHNVGSSDKTPCFTDKFLKFCMTCDNSLEGEDIYIYRGDSSFCSEECREREIEADKQKKLMNAAAKKSSYSKSNAAANLTDKRIFCEIVPEIISA